MSTPPVTGQTGKLEKPKDKSSQRWNHPVWLGIPGFITLGSSIASLQNMAKFFADDIDQAIFVANWIPWLAVLCFGLGWFLTDRAEVALIKNQHGIAKSLLAVALVGSPLIFVYLLSFSSHEVLHRFASPAVFMVLSGYLFRYSAFKQDSVLELQKLFFAGK
jgi:cation transport ATPase